MLAITIATPKPLSSELNTERVIDFGFHSGGANKGEPFIYRELSYFVVTPPPPPFPDPLYYK